MNASSMLRGAIVGFGHVAAEGHAPVWTTRPDAFIVAAVDASAERRERFLRTRPGGHAYATVEAMLDSEQLDFVDVCTPPNSHAEVVQQALAAGLHVLCEKPLTTSAADALAIADAADRAGRQVHAVHNWMAAPLCRKVSALLEDGAVGAVQNVEWKTLRTRPSVAVGGDGDANWRLDPAIAGGGILLDHGWHAAYCVARWVGTEPRRLSARLESRRFSDLAVEDTATLDLDFGQASGRIFLTWAADERANTVVIEGDRGRIDVAGGEVILRTLAAERRWSCPPALSEGSHHPDWFAAVADDFVAAAGGVRASNLAEAVMCAQVMDGAKASDASGGAWIGMDAPPVLRALAPVDLTLDS